MNFVAAGIDPSEGPDLLRSYVQAQGYPWTVGSANRDVLQRFNVTATATKYAVDRQGVITFTRGYGVEPAATWEQVFETLTKS